MSGKEKQLDPFLSADKTGNLCVNSMVFDACGPSKL